MMHIVDLDFSRNSARSSAGNSYREASPKIARTRFHTSKLRGSMIVTQPKAQTKKMKMLKHKSRLILTLALAVVATPVLSFSAEEKKMDPLMEPVKSVYDHYLAIQKELAQDSIKGVDEHASAIAKAVEQDDMKMLSPDVAKQAQTLAKAKDLKAARDADKPLSQSLIKYLADNKAGKGMYHEAYCPMVKASWLQTDKAIKNPYMGKAMLGCGELRN